MTLQSQVFTSVAVGVPGAKADMNVFDYYPQSLTAEVGIKAGTFVWLGTDPERQGNYGGTGAPIGFVERNLVYPNYDPLEDGSNIVAEGETLTVATMGAFMATTTTVASVGQAVFAATVDGSVSAADAGSTVAGSVETEWTVTKAGAAGETITIKRR